MHALPSHAIVHASDRFSVGVFKIRPARGNGPRAYPVIPARNCVYTFILIRVWAGHVARMGESRDAYKVLMENPERRRPLGRPRRRLENDIKMDLGEVGWWHGLL